MRGRLALACGFGWLNPAHKAPNNGVSGQLHRVTSVADVTKVLAEASTLPVAGDGVALLLAPEAVTTDTMRKVLDSDQVVGLLFETHNATSRPAFFSPADADPNGRYGLHAQEPPHAWNPNGLGLITANIGTPWVSLGSADTAAIAKQLQDSVTSGVMVLHCCCCCSN